MRDILCVDDESDNLIVFEATFEQDFRIWPVTSGHEALELLEQHSFPVVVADQRMPQMTGSQLFEIMRRKHPHTKRIMLTGYADNEAMLSAINQGQVYNFIKKPWEQSVVFPLLLGAIEAYDLAVSNLALTDRLVTVDRCAALGRCARIAHEMGNQLCMLPLLELIEEKYAHLDDLAQTAEFARGTYDRLVELINEVKAFVRQQHSDTVLQPMLLTETLHELMDFLRYDATLPVARCSSSCLPEPTVKGNKTKLQQVLVNLLKNAAHAVKEQPEGRIVVSLDCHADQAVIRVSDNGIGMTPEVMERIWDPFFTTKGESGTGLGLDISRSIIQSHGGKIECTSARARCHVHNLVAGRALGGKPAGPGCEDRAHYLPGDFWCRPSVGRMPANLIRRISGMRVLLTEPRGFCAGVNMAVEALDRAVRLFGTPLYVFHEIVHNRQVVDQFRQRGVVFVDHIHEVPRGAHLMYSAHGVSPAVRVEAAQRELRVIDATCPLVRKVHLQAQRFAEQGYSIVLVGHSGHDEIVGTLGESPDQIHLVETVDDVDRLSLIDPNKVAYLTQTTLSVDEANVIVDRLKQRYPPVSVRRRRIFATPRRTGKKL